MTLTSTPPAVLLSFQHHSMTAATDSVHPVGQRRIHHPDAHSTNNSPADGCCLLKALISNLVAFATRSRRKAADLSKENTRAGIANNVNNSGLLPSGQVAASTMAACPTASSKKTGVVSFSQTGSAKLARKTQSVDTCVADSLDDATLDKMCAIPPCMDKNEWLATQTLVMFDHVNALCGTVSDICTPVSCSIMSYPGNSKASWVDERGKRHHYSGMRYIDSVMSFCEGCRKNQAMFPTKFGARFASDFEANCRRMTRLLWYCCGHLYSKHWDQMNALNLRPQFGLVLAHMNRMAKIYGLLDTKELQAISQTLQSIRPSSAADKATTNGSGTTQSRPTKRLNTDNDGAQKEFAAPFSPPVNMNNRWSQQVIRIPAMKSGSWGGQQSNLLLTSATNYAQTC